MSNDYYNNSKYYCIEYLIPMSDVIFDMPYPPITDREKTVEFLQQAILRYMMNGEKEVLFMMRTLS